jgi:hypothetical protein
MGDEEIGDDGLTHFERALFAARYRLIADAPVSEETRARAIAEQRRSSAAGKHGAKSKNRAGHRTLYMNQERRDNGD